MAYCTQTDVEHAAGGATKLLQLADFDADGVVDTAVLTAAIDEAEEWINSYCAKRYAVPFDTPPDIIVRECAREAVYRIKDSRLAATQRDHDTHDKREDWLEGISYGRISLGVDPPPTKASTVAPTVESDRTSVTGALNREDLEGFW